MIRKPMVSETDRQVWSDMLEWGVYRIACYLKKMEAEQKELWGKNDEFSETILSLEIHAFFQEKEEHHKDLQDVEPQGAVDVLAGRLELDAFERFCVVMAFFGELDYHFERLFIFLNNDWNQRLLSVEWAVRLFTMEMEVDSSRLSCFLPEGKLAQWVFDMRNEGVGSSLRKGLKLKASVLEFLLCSGSFQDKPYLKWSLTIEKNMHIWLQQDICRYLEAVPGKEAEPKKTVLFHIKGQRSREKLLYLLWYAAERGQTAGILDYGRMQEELAQEQHHKVLEEVVLAGGVLGIHNTEAECGEGKNNRKLSVFLQQAADRIPVIFLLSSQEKTELEIPWQVHYIPVEIRLPKGGPKKELWRQMAEKYSVSETEWSQVFPLYDFGMEEIEESLLDAERIAYTKGERTITASIWHEACRRRLDDSLKEWAVSVDTDCAWEELILPKEQKEELEQAVNQIKYRHLVYDDWGFSGIFSYGTGLSILLTGPPGTGKTMAARVLAGALEMKLYKIQLPAVVSKYIGETEKNLEQIFREGKKSPTVLFFDEADVLFGKRTEVKDSHDKFSNMEAAFLLQKMEEYSGVVILATNFPQNIDEAFKRRLTFTLEFYMPDKEHRYKLWKQSFPRNLPLESGVDLEYLAERFELSGSNIKNIAVNAAFLAAPRHQAVGMEHIFRALKNEYRKSGKYLSEEELC